MNAELAARVEEGTPTRGGVPSPNLCIECDKPRPGNRRGRCRSCYDRRRRLGELGRRMEALEAERLRPVPPLPTALELDLTALVDAVFSLYTTPADGEAGE